MKEAMFYEKGENQEVNCSLCYHRCTIKEGKKGICGVRENREGTLFSLVYGKSISENVDPIEKKPLFHFFPGSRSFSIATVGCNFKCLHCQNYSISQMPRDQKYISGNDLHPSRIVSLAKEYNCASISYTYTEPTIYFEYAYETSKLAKDEGLANIFVTNGYITPEALKAIQPYLNGANIDLKSFSDEFYRKICGAKLQPVLDSITLYHQLGIWTEITTLIIPTYNDSDQELRDIARFIKNLDEKIPWHISAFYPTYRLMNQPRTSVATLRKAREIGLSEGLRYVYEGNVPGEGGENTFCYNCNNLLIQRLGFSIIENRIEDSKCPNCQALIDGVSL
ncbi:MAG: radical SAM protein [Deltaproteobacteria bacterium DG_8]|nr:MAG: radical SAM protein [Deltaproteobacteria bacterium DG_8]